MIFSLKFPDIIWDGVSSSLSFLLPLRRWLDCVDWLGAGKIGGCSQEHLGKYMHGQLIILPENEGISVMHMQAR